MAEHLTRNEKVVGSIPTTSSKKEGIIQTDDTLFFVCKGFACLLLRPWAKKPPLCKGRCHQFANW